MNHPLRSHTFAQRLRARLLSALQIMSYGRRSRGAVYSKSVTLISPSLYDPLDSAVVETDVRNLKSARKKEVRRRRRFKERHGCTLETRANGAVTRRGTPPCPYPDFWTDLGTSAHGEELVDIIPIRDSEETDRTGVRSDLVELVYLHRNGSTRSETGVRLLSYPRKRNQQLRRETALHLAGHVALGDAAGELSGHRYLAKATQGFLDIPGCIFSIRHRAWANQRLSAICARDVPRDAFGFLTILAGVVPSLSVPPFASRNWMQVSAHETLARVGKALKKAGAVWVYLNGYWEIINKCGADSNRFRTAWQRYNWPYQLRVRYRDEQQYVPHLHAVLLAHDGQNWIRRRTIFTALRREFHHPDEVVLRGYKKPSERNAINVTAYANKPPWLAPMELMVEDALMRDRIAKSEAWPEGWFWIGSDERPDCPADIQRRIEARVTEVRRLELLRSAIGLRHAACLWPWQ